MSKVTSMRAAIAAHVRDGDTVVIEGFTHLICFAAGHEIIRQRRRDLTLCRLTPDLIYDQMIAAGCARKLVFSWAGNPGAGSLHAFRRAVEGKGGAPLEIEEYSHFGMVARLSAGAARLPFWTDAELHGHRSAGGESRASASVTCPYTGEPLATVPALNPDVTIVHAQRADAQGNTQIWGLLGVQKEAAFASRRVIVVVEELVDESVIRADPNRTLIPGLIVDAVVVEPWGAHPSYAQGYYDRDNEFYVGWEAISRDPAALARYLDEFVLRGRRSGGVRRASAAASSGSGRPSRVCAGVNYGYLAAYATSQPVTYSPPSSWPASPRGSCATAKSCSSASGLPNLACNLARATHAPSLVLIYESGAVGAVPERLAGVDRRSLARHRIAHGLRHGRRVPVVPPERPDRGRLPRRRADRPVGQHQHDGRRAVTSIPTVRLPGSGGAAEIAIHARRTLVVSRLSRRAFPEAVDFITSPGHRMRGRPRGELGMPGRRARSRS